MFRRSLLAAGALLAIAPAMAARAAQTAPACAGPPVVSNGLRGYLVQTGTRSWVGQRLPAPPVTCGPSGTATLLFLNLLRTFPSKPTGAQWKARYRALVQSAIAADTAYLADVGAYAQQRVAAYSTLMHCNVAPNPPGQCDNGTLAPSVEDVTIPPGISLPQETATIMADVAALRAMLPLAAPRSL